MTFRVGQKVVCIKRGRWKDGYGDEKDPQFGVVYTIRAINNYPSGDPGVMLCEIVNQPRNYDEGFYECDFKASNFRPLVERKTDISIFTKMLTDNRVEA